MTQNDMTRRGFLRLGALTAAGAGVATLAGCSPFGTGASADPGALRVAWYGGDPVHQAMRQALEQYGSTASAVRTSTQHAPFADYWDKIATQTAARNAPDVMRMSVDYFSAYADRGALLDLGPAVADGVVDVSEMRDGPRQSGILDGTRYGVGQSSIVNAGFLDREAAEAAGASAPPDGWTWDDLADWAAGVASDSGGRVHGTSDQGGHFELFIPYVRQLGTNPFSDDGSDLLVTADALESWWTYWADLRAAGGTPTAAQTAGVTGFENYAVVAGQSVLDFGWVQQITFLQPLMDSELELVLPPATHGGDPGYYVNSADMWSVASTTSAPEAATELIDFLVNDERAVRALGVTLGVPTSDRAVAQLDLEAGSPAARAVAFVDEVGPHVGDPPPPWPRAFTELSQLFTKTAQDIAFGSASPAQGTEAFLEQAARAMSLS
ncbi:ABC transporter substrate-binding protein [Promicromonospora sp. Marseille-Q5078]